MERFNTDKSIPLTPAQAIRIHGWMRPIRRLYWQAHVLARHDLTFAVLVDKMKLCDSTLAALHQLQPDIKQWVACKKVTLEDCEVMHRFWDVHPIRDFCIEDDFGAHEVKIGEILQAGLSFEALKGCKVTLEDLAKAGLNPDNMILFQYTLYEWRQLGFDEKHAACMTPIQVERVFGCTKHTLEGAFHN